MGVIGTKIKIAPKQYIVARIVSPAWMNLNFDVNEFFNDNTFIWQVFTKMITLMNEFNVEIIISYKFS